MNHGDDDPDIATEPTEGAAKPVVQDLPGYEIGEVIGRGGMGEVVVAFDQDMEREVAIKRIRAKPTEDVLRRFVREAKVQARLDHPAIVPVHELGHDNAGNPYFTMKRLAGHTLAEALDTGEPTQRLLRAFVDVCFAIELAHERGIVHRDLKPSTVMLGTYGDVYVIDWGVARILGARRTTAPLGVVDEYDTLSPDATASGTLLGTPGYIAPEQMKGHAAGRAADVYSLGAILFEILAGDPLHPHGKRAFASTLARPVDSPARRSPDRGVAPELDSACVAALAEEPEHRISARELAVRVQRYLDGDRDLEHRKELAADQLAKAREALADPARRAEAGQAASRALALDPESRDAAELVAQMILLPPKKLPPQLVASLDAEEARLQRQRSRVEMFAFLAIWLFAPVILVFQHVRDVRWFVALFVGATVMAVLSWHTGRSRRTPMWLLLGANFVFAFLFMRLTGSFVLGAACVCGQTLALSARSKPATLAIWTIVTMCVPVALEYFGVIERTWWMRPEGMLTNGAVLETTRDLDVLFLLLGQTTLALVVGFFALSTSRARAEAQRKAHIQAWHLQQLIPRGRG